MHQNTMCIDVHACSWPPKIKDTKDILAYMPVLITAPENTLLGFSMNEQTFKESELFRVGKETVSSNLPLQMALYFNVIFFPCWLISTLVILNVKFSCFSTIYQFIVGTVLIAVICIECLRLYLGYLGNLMERLPELAGFWMLSLLLQLPLQLYLLISKNTATQPLDFTVQTVMIVLLLVQLVSGFFALKTIATQQTIRFRFLQFFNSDGSITPEFSRPKSE